MEERIKQAAEYLLMAINDIKDYKDFINYKSELIKAINDIKNSIQNQNIINDSDENDKKSKISSILGLQFDYDSLINENDIKFFSDYEEKTNKVKNKINSYFNQNKKISLEKNNKKKLDNNNKKINSKNNKKPNSEVNNITYIQNNNNQIKPDTNDNKNIYNPDKTLNCTESLRNKNKLLNKYKNEHNKNINHSNKNKNNNLNQNTNKNKLFYTRYLHNKQKIKNKIENFFIEKKQQERIDLIAEIIMKLNSNEYIYDILVKLYGNNITDKLLSNEVSDDLVEAVQNTISEIEKLNGKYNENNNNLNQIIDKREQKNIDIPKNKIKKELNFNFYEPHLEKKIIKRPKRYHSSMKFKYSEPYQEYNFKNSLRFETTKNYYNNTYNNDRVIKSDSRNQRSKSNKKRMDSPNNKRLHQKPFISATCSYGKYFDEPLQKGGISKLEYCNY